MRSVIYGALFTVFLACAGTVQAANDLDGKSLLCRSIHLTYGLVFDQGKVTRYEVEGYSKTTAFTKPYYLDGTHKVFWGGVGLNRKTLQVGSMFQSEPDQCSISSKAGVFQKLDEIIAAAKKKNKI